MAKRVLDVGNCVPDHASMRQLLEGGFGAEVVQTHGLDDTLMTLRDDGVFDLVLINRKMDRDGSDGMEILRQIKADQKLKQIPVMLITNFPEYQQQAVETGAELGFGKLELATAATKEKLRRFLGEQ